MLVLLVEEEIVGFAGFSVNASRRTAELGLNAVHPDHAGRGIGTWMYGEALARMAAQGAATVEVGTGGDAAHAAARRAYEKAGFTRSIPAICHYGCSRVAERPPDEAIRQERPCRVPDRDLIGDTGARARASSLGRAPTPARSAT